MRSATIGVFALWKLANIAHEYTSLPVQIPAALKETWLIHMSRGVPDLLNLLSSGVLVSVIFNLVGVGDFRESQTWGRKLEQREFQVSAKSVLYSLGFSSLYLSWFLPAPSSLSTASFQQFSASKTGALPDSFPPLRGSPLQAYTCSLL